MKVYRYIHVNNVCSLFWRGIVGRRLEGRLSHSGSLNQSIKSMRKCEYMSVPTQNGLFSSKNTPAGFIFLKNGLEYFSLINIFYYQCIIISTWPCVFFIFYLSAVLQQFKKIVEEIMLLSYLAKRLLNIKPIEHYWGKHVWIGL